VLDVRSTRKCGQSAAPSPGAGTCTLCCAPKEDDCGAPVGGGRNGGSKLRMRQELREQHNGGTAVLEPRSFRTLLTNIDI
jgi:hypothetical protein